MPTTKSGRIPDAPSMSDVSNNKPTVETTPRWCWLLLYFATITLVAMRAPALHAEVSQQLSTSAERAQVGDPSMMNLAINVGLLLAVLLFALILAIYLSLASILDRQVFRPHLKVGGKVPLGLFFIIAAGCTLPVQVVTVLFSVEAPKSSPLFYGWVLTIAVTAPWLFRQHWINVDRSKKALLFAAALLLAAASHAA